MKVLIFIINLFRKTKIQYVRRGISYYEWMKIRKQNKKESFKKYNNFWNRLCGVKVVVKERKI
jgi:hypothetical protein